MRVAYWKRAWEVSCIIKASTKHAMQALLNALEMRRGVGQGLYSIWVWLTEP